MSDSPEARTVLRPGGKDVRQHQRTGPDSAKRFTPEAPTVFLDHLAASGNVSRSCAEAGISSCHSLQPPPGQRRFRPRVGGSAAPRLLADHILTATSPDRWATAAAAAAEAHDTCRVVAEQNQGGRIVKSILLVADPRLRIKLVTAHAGKSARAEPVAHVFEAGRACLHGRMPELEPQMLGMIAGGGYEGPGQSPDRADAMVGAVSDLMKKRAEPRVRVV